jgi:hypothetical protein
LKFADIRNQSMGHPLTLVGDSSEANTIQHFLPGEIPRNSNEKRDEHHEKATKDRHGDRILRRNRILSILWFLCGFQLI